MSPYRMSYTLLVEDQRDQLKRERVLALEADYYRLVLLLDEETDPDEAVRIGTRLADLERRIAVHLRGVADDAEADAIARDLVPPRHE
jgi:hypothetical protein